MDKKDFNPVISQQLTMKLFANWLHTKFKM